MQQRDKGRVSAIMRRWKRKGAVIAVVVAATAAVAAVTMGAAQMIGHEYVLSDGQRYVTVRLYPGTAEQAVHVAGFDGLMVRGQYESCGTTYLMMDRMLYAEIERDGAVSTVPFSPCTVEELLNANGITLSENEVVTPSLSAFLSQDANISISSVTYETVTETEEINYGVLVRENDALESGQRQVVRAGEKGEKEITFRVALENGQEIERIMLRETVVREPVDCVIDRGTGDVEEEDVPQAELSWDEGVIFPGQSFGSEQDDVQGDASLPAAGDGLSTAGKDEIWSAPTQVTVDAVNHRITTPQGDTYSYSEVLTVKATAYHRLEEGGLITATGTTTQYGTVAVDPSVIPLGTRVLVVSEDGISWSYGPGLAEDTGGLIKGSRIDLFFMTGDEATNFGVRSAKIYLLSDE